MKKLLWMLVVLVSGFALAQGAAPVIGPVQVPDYVWAIASVAIGWLVKEISSPLTALLKKRLGFQGDVTRYVYIVLSGAFVVGFGLIGHAFGSGPAGIYAALGAYLTALVKGFGGYQMQKDATAAALGWPGGIVTPAVDAGYTPATWADVQATTAHDEAIPLVKP